jgi:hypothetical protein
VESVCTTVVSNRLFEQVCDEPEICRGDNNTMINIRSLTPGAAIRIVKTFRDYYGDEFVEGRILHFTHRDYLPYHSGHTVHFREATIYLCDDDRTGAIVQNHNEEYFALAGQSD